MEMAKTNRQKNSKLQKVQAQIDSTFVLTPALAVLEKKVLSKNL